MATREIEEHERRPDTSEKRSVEMTASHSKIRLEEAEEEQDVGSWAKLNGRTIVSHRRENLSVCCYLSNYYCSRKLILSFIDQHLVCLTPRCR